LFSSTGLWLIAPAFNGRTPGWQELAGFFRSVRQEAIIQL
jgi:hypothetical protein